MRAAALLRTIAIAAAVVAAVLLVGWLTGVGHAPSVKRVAHASPELQAAARRAQSELDSFIAQLSDPRPGERFAIKGAFPTPEGPEYLWVRNPQYARGKFIGILDQAPLAYREAQRGDPVAVPKKDVFDWLIKDGAQTQGGYTERALTPK